MGDNSAGVPDAEFMGDMRCALYNWMSELGGVRYSGAWEVAAMVPR